MLCLYVGDARDIVKRILTNHCTGNVEGSAFRKAVAEAIGYNLTYTKRKSGSMRVRIDFPNPREGEKKFLNIYGLDIGDMLSVSLMMKHMTFNGI